ncbi:hypothetical protein RSOE_23940 [Ralstonia solanacearum OE1-1]|nr:hypothetical protein RSOE_23940 [Ralstonia solanacearum OE1-1]
MQWVLVPLAVLFFASLFSAIHALDVGAALYREQGAAYYAQAYLAFGLVLPGSWIDWRWSRRYQ